MSRALGGVFGLLLLIPQASEALVSTPARPTVAAGGARCQQQQTGWRLAHPSSSSSSDTGVLSRRGPAPRGWAAARAHVRCSLLSGVAVDDEVEAPVLREGDRVRVRRSIKFMNVPGRKGGYDASGSIGTVLPSDLSANHEVKVEFVAPNPKKKWVGHFEPRELEPLAAADDADAAPAAA